MKLRFGAVSMVPNGKYVDELRNRLRILSPKSANNKKSRNINAFNQTLPTSPYLNPSVLIQQKKKSSKM